MLSCFMISATLANVIFPSFYFSNYLIPGTLTMCSYLPCLCLGSFPLPVRGLILLTRRDGFKLICKLVSDCVSSSFCCLNSEPTARGLVTAAAEGRRGKGQRIACLLPPLPHTSLAGQSTCGFHISNAALSTLLGQAGACNGMQLCTSHTSCSHRLDLAKMVTYFCNGLDSLSCHQRSQCAVKTAAL